MVSISTFAENLKTDIPPVIASEPVFAIGRMVAFISHDLRQPLTAILANAEFLTRPDASEKQRVDFFREIRWDIDRIDALLSSLLECSKGRDALMPAARDIVQTVECAIRMTSVRHEFRRITIKHYHKGRTVGWFDASRMQRVIANLTLNACEAVDSGSGKVVITSVGNRDSLQIRVWDNGPGISPAIRASILQCSVSYGKPAGSGLGLMIAKKLVEDHGGTIHLDERCATGTAFKVKIPFAIPRKRLPAPHPSSR
ncbi:sensor histidine kinase [Acidisarcina polymorpha]|nr:HAMP domain-containing sensor histidine kinase [Acidisarcina polymorpha]